MPQVSITINRPEVSVSTTQTGPTVTISETPVAITQNTSEIAVTTNPQVVQINTAATTIQTTTLDEAFKGDWSADVIYHRGDLVRHEQAVYVYINTTPSTTLHPDVDTDLWVLLFSESGLSAPQVAGINRAINLMPWDSTTAYSVGDIVVVTETHDTDGIQNQPFPVLYRLYSATGSINVDPLLHHNFPSYSGGQPVYDITSAWQRLTGVASVNGLSGDVELNTDAIAEGTTNKYYSELGFDASLANKTTDDLAEGLANLYWTAQRFDGQLATKTTDDLSEGTTNLYWTTIRGDQNFADNLTNTSTDDLSEGTTNLYHTTARVRNSISATGDIAYNSTTGVISYSAPTAPVTSVNSQTGAVVLDTDDIGEGTTNLYYTDGRFDTRLAAKTTTNLAEGTNLYYTTARANADFDTRLATKTTTNLAEGTNLYYTTARANSDFDTRLATKSTTNLAEGTNLYYTNTRARSALSGSTGITYNNTTGAIAIDDTVVATHAYVGTQIANLVDSAPSTLDTLNELAAALGDDPNFATTITTALGNKLNTADFTSTANTWYATSDPIQNNTTDDLAEGTTNLYHTTARVRNSISGGSGIGYNPTTGEITADVVSVNGATGAVYLDTDDISEGTTNQYYTTARARSAYTGTGNITVNATTGVISFDGPTGPDTTDELTEGTTNLYYTDARSRSAISLGYSGIGAGLTYNNTTGAFNYVAPDTDDVPEGLGNLYFTYDRARSAVANGVDLAVDGSNNVYVKSLRNATRVYGGMEASTNASYVFPPQTLSTVADNNGYSAASSFPAGTTGYGANASFTHYYGDTLAGVNTAPAFNFRNANGNSSTGDLIPFTGLTSTNPSATLSGNVMGTLNYNGYGTTGFTNDIATTYQGGGINALSSMQLQSYPTENFSDSVLTLTSTNVTAVASSFRAPMSATSVVGTKGQIQFGGTSGAVGQAVRVTGTLTGTATGIVSGQTYYMIVYSNNGTNSFATLSATPGGVPITTTAGTLTGLTLTRCSVTFTTTGLTNVPFGRGALVTISGITNITDGTYPVWGTPTTATFSIGVPHTVAPTVAGAQTFSCRSVYMGSGLRIRAFPTATPATLQNRLEVLDLAPGATTIRTNSLTLNTGAYGNTGTALPGGDINYRRTYGCFHKMANVTAAAANTVYAFDWTADTTPHVNTKGVTVSNTSRIVFDNAGDYNVVIEMVGKNIDSQDRVAYVWLAKNGTDLAETAIKLVLSKETTTMLAKDWLVNGIADNDYIEVRFAVDTTTSGISLEYTPAQTTPYVRPAVASATITITPIGA